MRIKDPHGYCLHRVKLCGAYLRTEQQLLAEVRRITGTIDDNCTLAAQKRLDNWALGLPIEVLERWENTVHFMFELKNFVTGGKACRNPCFISQFPKVRSIAHDCEDLKASAKSRMWGLSLKEGKTITIEQVGQGPRGMRYSGNCNSFSIIVRTRFMDACHGSELNPFQGDRGPASPRITISTKSPTKAAAPDEERFRWRPSPAMIAERDKMLSAVWPPGSTSLSVLQRTKVAALFITSLDWWHPFTAWLALAAQWSMDVLQSK